MLTVLCCVVLCCIGITIAWMLGPTVSYSSKILDAGVTEVQSTALCVCCFSWEGEMEIESSG